jgi:hypothetical protein
MRERALPATCDVAHVGMSDKKGRVHHMAAHTVAGQ